MNALDEVKNIIESQKSVRTSRLQPLIKEIEMMYINQGYKIRKQERHLGFLRMVVERRKNRSSQ
ncbi:hypothetical protein ACMG4J_22615 [Rossellomorea marisflavi]|uniref:hypothetical protein n=1 Tax=Rossellomorea marisflavi TaxID=189381 RepID=UPI0039BFAC36